MSIYPGHLETVNCVGIEFLNDAQDLKLELIDAVHPHETKQFLIKNVIACKMSRMPSASFPFMIVDLTWTSIPESLIHKKLADNDFGFYDEHGNRLLDFDSLIEVHFEGDICGNVLGESVVVSQDL